MTCEEFEYSAGRHTELSIKDDAALRLHLTTCGVCRSEFNATTEMRRQIGKAVGSSSDFAIDSKFNAGLELQLKKEFFRPTEDVGSTKSISFKFFLPTMAVLLLAVGIGFFVTNRIDVRSVAENYLATGLSEIGSIVAGNHVYCTLEKLGMWETLSHTDHPDKSKYNEVVVSALKANYSDSVQLISIHDCAFEGKDFRHVILRSGAEIVSVFLDKTDRFPTEKLPLTSPIVSSSDSGFQISSFAVNERLVFVVSKLPESDSLTIARTLSYAMSQI